MIDTLSASWPGFTFIYDLLTGNISAFTRVFDALWRA